MRLPALSVAVVSVLVAGQAFALPPGEQGRGLRDGANHHLGDDSFVEQEGRAPADGDSEATRMHAQLAYVRQWLAARPATRPELVPQRAKFLGYLDDYIAQGITPKNDHLPWRTPVFIDDGGAICAVGYLIERSVGRELAENIARAHRYDLLEDIAADMPAVRAWASETGFSLEELASIQPGYEMPAIERWHAWDGPSASGTHGTWDRELDGRWTHGTLRAGTMEGRWTVVDGDQHVLGEGELANGAGAWTSHYPDGAKLATGRYANNQPDGVWRFYHPSGVLAAEGGFEKGTRSGPWRFFHDGPGEVPIATGSFAHGGVSGDWHHYDAAGKLVATTRDETPRAWSNWGWRPAGHMIDVAPSASGVHHWIHEGNVQGDFHRLDMLIGPGEHLYVHRMQDVIDADGHWLVRNPEGQWTTSDCHWNRKRKAIAHAGDVATLHGILTHASFDTEACKDARPVSAGRVERIETMLASVRDVRSESPDFVRKLVLGETTVEEAAAADADAAERDPFGLNRAAARDLAKVLAANMTWYVEWPHVDGRFVSVFRTLAGYSDR